jgi:3-hydroxybutyryl-CoA dehydratase
LYFEEFEIGQRFPLERVVIKKENMLAFAKEYDPLPLHIDENYAAKTQFGALIAPGVMSFMSVWSQFLRKEIINDALIAGKSTKIEWLAPVYENDILEGTAIITGLTSRNAYNGLVEITVDIFNQDGLQVIRDVTEAILKKQPKTDA